MTCHVCGVEGLLAMDLFTYYLGSHKGKPVHRIAHRECSRELYRRFKEWRAAK